MNSKLHVHHWWRRGRGRFFVDGQRFFFIVDSSVFLLLTRWSSFDLHQLLLDSVDMRTAQRRWPGPIDFHFTIAGSQLAQRRLAQSPVKFEGLPRRCNFIHLEEQSETTHIDMMLSWNHLEMVDALRLHCSLQLVLQLVLQQLRPYCFSSSEADRMSWSTSAWLSETWRPIPDRNSDQETHFCVKIQEHNVKSIRFV